MNTKCVHHPEREATFYCQKDGTHFCEECACCWSPHIYCKFRTACVIDALTKEGTLKPCHGERPRADG